MSSLLTNISAMSALRALTATQKALIVSEDHLSSGLRVANASDDAAYWSIATEMRSQTSGLSVVNDALNLTKSIADVTAAALKTVIASTQAIQKDIVTAQQPGVSLSQVQADIAAQQNAIRQTASSASFNGVNWLVGSDTFVTQVDETETYDTDYATYRSILDHTASPSTESNATVSYFSSVTKTDTNGNSSFVASSYGGDVRFYGVYYFHPTISGSTSGALLPDYTMIPTSMSATGTAFSRIETGSMQLFTSSTNTTTINHTASWTDKTIQDHQTDVFTGISDPTVVNGAGIFGGSIGFSSGTSSLLGMDISNFTASDLKAASDAVSTALKGLIGASTAIAAIQNQIGIQAGFNSALSDALTSGIGSLVDADMNVASTRLKALQTQRLLGIQALSIANDNSLQILKLFG